jgi:TonB-linked SusC/RagA family outer membrane protein
MKKKLCRLPNLLFLLFLLNAPIVFAQTKTIKGVVKDEKAIPVFNVNVLIKNSNRGTTTNSNGEFEIQAKPSDVIIFTAVSFQPKEVRVGDGTYLNIIFTPSAQDMDQVMVIGYGTQKKKDLTGAVSTIGAKDVGGRQTLQISEALQGGISGVSVTRSSGAPGASSSILIRGVSTIGNNTPLFLVDGVQVGNIDNINPNDVESISVLKDAASASIYGSRAAAGVVLVTTKRGKTGQKSFEYNYEYGAQKPTALPEYAGAADYMRYFNEQATNDGAATGPYPIAYINNFADSNRLNPDRFPFANTDWQKVIMTNRYAPRQRHDLVFTTGTDKLKTKASLGYSNAGAFYDNFTFERYILRVNNDLQINDKLAVSLDVSYNRTNNVSPTVNPIYEARLMPAIFDDYYADGRYAIAKDGRNPIAELKEGGTDKRNFNQILGRLAFVYKPVNGLQLTALVSPSFDFEKRKDFAKRITFNNPDGTPSGFGNRPRTVLSESRAENLFITGQFLADYNKQFNNVHNIGILVGYEELFNNYEFVSASRAGFSLNDFPYLNSGSQEIRDNSGFATESALRSVFGRFKYDYKNKYYIQGNLRYDQSSRFARDYRGAMFPSVSAGWTLTEEKFVQGAKWLSFLKVRGSYGQVGNERIGDYPYQATISFSNPLFYQNNVVVPQTGGAQIEYAVENISWETTRTSNIGIDATFLNNRLTFSGDYYKKSTDAILLKLDIPLYLGLDKPNQNAGVLDVKGWEFDLGWKDKVGKLRYAVAFNLSDAKSSIVDLKGTVINAGGPLSSFKGSEFNEWFGYRSKGLYQTVADTIGSPRLNSSVTAGDVRYEDTNGDGKLTPDDKVLLGGSLPRFLYGGNIRLDYEGIDFAVVFQGVGKRLSRLSDDVIRPFQEAFGNVPLELVGKYWSKTKSAGENSQATYPRLSTRSLINNYETSDFWLIDGSYFRVKNITLGYTLANNKIKRLGLQTCRLYIAANDVFAIHSFPKYLDPEVGNASYPIVRTFMVGASIRF